MAQYIYTMNGVGKIVPPKKYILKDINLNFFPGAKIGVLGYNGAGKSTLLRIMAGVDTEIVGEARPQPGIEIGYLPQEPHLDPEKDVRGNVEDGVASVKEALTELDQVYAAYAEPDADFDALAAKQAELEAKIEAADGHNLDRKLEVAADALRLPPWDADVNNLSGGERRRVALCRLLLSSPDMLILDEPTNHLDIKSKGVLIEAIQQYSGTCIIVSHDRYFLDQVCSHVWRVGGGDVRIFHGSYSEMQWQVEHGSASALPDTPASSNGVSSASESSESKDNHREKTTAPNTPERPDDAFSDLNSYQVRQKMDETETAIMELEDEKESLESRMSMPEELADGEMQELAAAYQEVDAKLDELYATWEALTEHVMALDAS